MDILYGDAFDDTNLDDTDTEPVEEDEDDWGDWPRPYRDDRVHVMREKCSTCVFRPGNLMNLPPGRLKDMAEHVQATGVPFACHQTLPYASDAYRDHYRGAALCAGAVENYGADSLIMRLAHAQDVITEVAPAPCPGADT